MDRRNRWALGQSIDSLYQFVKERNLYSNFGPEDADEWSRLELNNYRKDEQEFKNRLEKKK